MPATQTNTRSLPIERRHQPSYTDFVKEFLKPHEPVILTGAIDGWTAMQWTPQYFQEAYPGKVLRIDGKDYQMEEFIQLVQDSTAEAPSPYLRNAIIDHFDPKLLSDITPLPEYFSPNWLDGPLSNMLRELLHGGSAELYIGGKGGMFPYLHYDACHTHAFICQLYGTKEFTCFPEDQTEFLYIRADRDNISQIRDIENPDYSQYPLFAKATPIHFVLRPGEVLFIPGGLWHTARMLTPSISVSVNRANSSNWPSVSRDICAKSRPLKKPVAAAYLAALGVFRSIYGS